MSNPHKRNAPTFPENYGWVTSRMHGYKPRDAADDVKQALCEMFLQNDKDFQHLLRQCAATWIVSVVLGKDTVHMNVYDPYLVDHPDQVMTQSAQLTHAQMFEVDRQCTLRPLTPERVQAVHRCHAMVYSARTLKSQEVQALDQYQKRLENVAPAGVSGTARAALAQIDGLFAEQ